jgi:hypothetical protein
MAKPVARMASRPLDRPALGSAMAGAMSPTARRLRTTGLTPRWPYSRAVSPTKGWAPTPVPRLPASHFTTATETAVPGKRALVGSLLQLKLFL